MSNTPECNEESRTYPAQRVKRKRKSMIEEDTRSTS